MDSLTQIPESKQKLLNSSASVPNIIALSLTKCTEVSFNFYWFVYTIRPLYNIHSH